MTGDRPYSFADITYKIRGSVFNVYNTLGFGHKEMVYQNALSIEFQKHGLGFKEQPQLKVLYDGKAVGNYVPDFIVDNKVIIELKSTEFLTKIIETQLVYYLKGTGYHLGLLINFGRNKLEIKRKIWG